MLCSFGISNKDEVLDLPSFYWIPKLHKCTLKQRYIAGSAKFSMEHLFKLLTCILSTIKTELQILKNSKYIQSRPLSSCNSIKPFDFSTLYTIIPHSKLKGVEWLNGTALILSNKPLWFYQKVWYKLCSSSRRIVPLFVWGRFHTRTSQEKRKEDNPILQCHIPLYRWCPFTR